MKYVKTVLGVLERLIVVAAISGIIFVGYSIYNENKNLTAQVQTLRAQIQPSEERLQFIEFADSIMNLPSIKSDLSTSEKYLFANYVWQYGKEFDVNDSDKHGKGLPYLILSKAIVESGLRKNAVSSTGTRGILQITRPTFRLVMKDLNQPITNINKDILDLRLQAMCAAYYSRILYEEYRDWNLAITRYNCFECNENSGYAKKVNSVMRKLNALGGV